MASHIAYTPLGDRSSMWKNYRGGTVSRIWLFATADSSVVEIPKPETGSNDNFPQYLDGKVYFRSDREGEYNLYVYDPASERVERLTAFTNFPVISLSAGDGGVIFEQAGYLHFYDPATQQHRATGHHRQCRHSRRKRPRYVTGGDNVRSAGVSPSGTRSDL